MPPSVRFAISGLQEQHGMDVPAVRVPRVEALGKTTLHIWARRFASSPKGSNSSEDATGGLMHRYQIKDARRPAPLKFANGFLGSEAD